MNVLRQIYLRFKTAEEWTPPLPRLDRHVEHFGGSGGTAWLTFLILVSHGFVNQETLTWQLLFWWIELSTIVSISIFATVEIATGVVRKNWDDSLYDLLQYCIVVIVLPIAYGYWYLLAGLALPWMYSYFWILLHPDQWRALTSKIFKVAP